MQISNNLFDVIYVDDPRIEKHFTRELEGAVDIHIHYDPRTVGVYALPVQAKMWAGESVEMELDERAALLGVITELAAHHPRARLYLNGLNQTPQYMDTFLLGQVDGLGCIKWFILPSGKKRVKLAITDSYNPLLPQNQRIRCSGFCFGGFMISNSMQMPAPIYSTAGWTLKDLNSDVIPRGGWLDIGDVPHPCELQLLTFSCDSSEVEVCFADGWGEGALLNPNWAITLDELYAEIGHAANQKLHPLGSILKWEESQKSVAITLPAAFMAGMRIRLTNLNQERDVKLLGVRCMTKVRLC